MQATNPPSPFAFQRKCRCECSRREFRRRRHDVLPIVRHFDSAVGDAYHQFSLERRIDDAEKAGTPWEFTYILRGAWETMRDQLNTLRDHDRADLVLAIVAACQVASLDAGTNEETVERYAGHLKRDAAWARAGLELLRKRGALFPGGGPLRCPHIMAAVRIISGTLKNHVDGSFWQFVDVLRQLARDTIGNPRGLSWLLEDSQVLALAFYRDPSNKATLFARRLWMRSSPTV